MTDSRLDIGSHFSAALRAAFDAIDLPVYVLDVERRPAWANRAAHVLLREPRIEFAQALAASTAPEFDLTLDASSRFRVKSAPLRESGAVVGTLGILLPIPANDRPVRERATGPDVALTPRQSEVLRLLSKGCDTRQIANDLHLAEETVRNHVRAVLGRLGVHSRLEAVVVATRLGLVDDPRD